MMVAKFRSWLIVVGLILISGCASPLSQHPIDYARKVSDWPGVSHLTQDGMVYFAGQPSAEALRAAKARGIATVINFRSEPEMKNRVAFDEAAIVHELGMNYVFLPITLDTFSISQADELHEVLKHTREPVLLHCASSNRVGAVWALYLVRHRDVPVEQAIAMGMSAGMRSEKLIAAVQQLTAR